MQNFPSLRGLMTGLPDFLFMHHMGFQFRLLKFHLPSDFVEAPSLVSTTLFLLSPRYEAKAALLFEFHIHIEST